jgi:hypothetical protein
MGSRGMFVSHWTLGFDLGIEFFITPIWIRLLHLPITLLDEDSLKTIGDKLGHYID